MRGLLIGLLVAMVGLCAACSDEQRPGVSPAAAKRAIQKRAAEWSSGGRIVDLSCRSDSDDSGALTCEGSPVECGGGTPTERWSVHRGRNGKAVVILGEPEQTTYCIVNTSDANTVEDCQSQPYLKCDATEP
jgi:hypothetical protein